MSATVAMSSALASPPRGGVRVKVLVVDRSADDVRALTRLLGGRGGFDVESVGTVPAALRHLERSPVDAVLLDAQLPDTTVPDAVRQLTASFPNVPVVVFGPRAADGAGLSAIREGAQDYLVEDELSPGRLADALAYAVERRQAHRDAVRTALDHFPVGVVLVSEDRRVSLVNRAAAEILDEGDGLRVQEHVLRGATPQDTRKLQDLVAQAAAATARELAPRALSIARRRKRPLSVLAAPNRAADPQGGRRKASVVLFVCDADRRMDAGEAILRPLYGLSPAEARVAWGLMQGKSLEEICEEAGVTINTGRTQLRRVLEKTGTRRQGELIRVLLSGPAPLRVMQVLLALTARALIGPF